MGPSRMELGESPRLGLMGRERRRYERRARSIRLRFEADGEEHRAVTTTVSPGGAFVKAAFVPVEGTRLTFREVYTQGGPTIFIQGEVRWTVPRPTLARPDTGFGLRFISMYTRDDPSSLEDFLAYVDPDRPEPPIIDFEERKDGVYAVHHFDDDRVATTTRDASSADGELEELPAVDLAREVDRLARGEERVARAGVEATASSASPEGPGVAPPKPRTRRRTVTGIFTALFGRRREPVEEAFEGRRDAVTPVVGSGADGTIRDARRPLLRLAWADGEAEVRIERLTAAQADVRASGPAAPEVGARVTLVPLEVPGAGEGMRLEGTVADRSRDDGGAWLRLVVTLDPPASPGAEAARVRYLRLVNGPAV